MTYRFLPPAAREVREAARFRPMLLTAMAVVVGAGVILFDPIFQGLAISLTAGEIASLLNWPISMNSPRRHAQKKHRRFSPFMVDATDKIAGRRFPPHRD